MRTLLGFAAFLLLTIQVASARTTVTGTLLDQDGKPMQMANVSITRYVDVGPGAPSVKMVQAEKDGEYSITIDSSGVWGLVFTGVSHASHEIALYVDKPETIHLDVRLKTYDYPDTFAYIAIEGRFNHFNPHSALPMKKMPNGTYTAKFDTKNDSSFAYEIVGAIANRGATNGTESERYIYDPRSGSYKSVVTPKDKSVLIVFDPDKLIRSNKPVRVAFADPQSFDAKFAQLYDEMRSEQKEWTAAYLKYKSSGKDVRNFKYDWSGVFENLHDRLAHETNSMLRQGLYFNYVWLHGFGADVPRSVFKAALKECSPTSWIWALDPFKFIRVLSGVGVKGKDFCRLMTAFIEGNPCMWDSKALVLEEETILEKLRGDTSGAVFCYNLLESKYGNTPYGRVAKEEHTSSRAIADGKKAPFFSITSLADSSKHFTNATFKGKYYMIDFWATWCGPCVGEMSYLQKAYEKFKDKNFVMLSVSLDQSPKDVETFREGRWHMPWLQAFAYGGWKNKMAEDFEAVEIPHPILINPAGKIVAMDTELRGNNLEKTLERFLGK